MTLVFGKSRIFPVMIWSAPVRVAMTLCPASSASSRWSFAASGISAAFRPVDLKISPSFCRTSSIAAIAAGTCVSLTIPVREPVRI